MPEITPAILAAADKVDADLDALDMSTRTLLALLRAGDPPPSSGGGVGFPVFESSTSNDGDSTAATSHTVTLPGGLASGDLLVVVARVINPSTEPTISGWTEVNSRVDTNSTKVWSKVSDGTETTVSVDCQGTSTRIAWIAMRFSNAASIEGEFAGSNTVDPPEYTTSFGSAEVLWMAVASDRQSNFTFTEPSGYTGEVEAGNASSSFTSRFRVAVAFREVEASVENPGAWTRSDTESAPHAGTFAIRS